MSWESAGYGIHPFKGTCAPDIDVTYQDDKTVFKIVMPKKLNFKQVESITKTFFEIGEEALKD
jgi:hypothetical protein